MNWKKMIFSGLVSFISMPSLGATHILFIGDSHAVGPLILYLERYQKAKSQHMLAAGPLRNGGGMIPKHHVDITSKELMLKK